MNVLIIGGYGTFGYGIADLLSDEAELIITLAGRSFDKAKAACRTLSGKAKFKALKLDRNGDLAAQIDTPPDIIIDASGPFQNYDYGKRDNVIEYALAKGCHYLDLADDLNFVADIRSFDEAAKERGLTLLSGLSTYPVLTAAALKELSKKMDGITDIRAGIAPSPRAVMGRNVIAAVAAYAGQKRVGVLRGGTFTKTHGLTETHRETICVPGHKPLPNILFSVVEGPDPQELPRHFESLQNIWMSAGPRPEFLHRTLIGLAWLVRLKLLPNIAWLTGLFHKTQSLVSTGEHRGGMFVRASNRTQSRSWHMIAECDDGPRIPSIPAAIMVRKWLRNEGIPSGARTAITDISLADYDSEFTNLNITHGIHDDIPKAGNLYEEILGPAYNDMSEPLQTLHRIGAGKHFEGRCKVTRGANPLSHIVATLLRFPKASPDIPVRVVLTKKGQKEIWERFFDGRRMVSTQEAGRGKQSRLVIERFGPIAVYLAILVEDGKQILKTTGWSLFGIPLPKALTPGGEVFEHAQDGRFCFHVDLVAPVFGRLVKYEGWLEHISETKAE
ncbi:SDR family oxidoreductase [Hellea balneolensis]|uniref:SDR family oxidoreductase n=1 Tax=Hellea balneolensis TaxID=287478 RepID=UPI000420C06F|nr:SDR family oxidoreductase [Hellea balneolensis]